LAHDAQHIFERLLIELAHAQRLRAAIQHLKRFIGLLQTLGFFLYLQLQRLIEPGQFVRHGAEGLRQHAELVRQRHVQLWVAKIPLLHALAGVDQMLQRGDHLAAHETNAKQHQTDDGGVTQHADGGHQGQFQFGIALQGGHEMVNAIDMAGDLRPIGDRLPVADLPLHRLPRLLQRQVMVAHLGRYVEARQFLQRRRLQ
jgi:hypothetical protein